MNQHDIIAAMSDQFRYTPPTPKPLIRTYGDLPQARLLGGLVSGSDEEIEYPPPIELRTQDGFSRVFDMERAPDDVMLVRADVRCWLGIANTGHSKNEGSTAVLQTTHEVLGRLTLPEIISNLDFLQENSCGIDVEGLASVLPPEYYSPDDVPVLLRNGAKPDDLATTLSSKSTFYLEGRLEPLVDAGAAFDLDDLVPRLSVRQRLINMHTLVKAGLEVDVDTSQHVGQHRRTEMVKGLHDYLSVKKTEMMGRTAQDNILLLGTQLTKDFFRHDFPHQIFGCTPATASNYVDYGSYIILYEDP
jgi:hypothetical protein